MPLKTKQPGQFMVLMTGIVDINHSSLQHHQQNLIVVHNHAEILKLIATTQFDLILLDLTVNRSVVSELIALIKDPDGINNETPIIAIRQSTEGIQYPMEFDDNLAGPIAAEQLNELIGLWQTRALALTYIQAVQLKTKNNHRLSLTLFEKLFEELPLQIINIKDALENKQYDLAQTITHKLNGSVSFCGLTDIQQPANALESCLLKQDYAAIDQQFLALQQHTLNFTRHQESILANLDKC